MNHIKASVRFTFVNKPKDHLGLCGEWWTVGKKPMPLSRLIVNMIGRTLEFAEDSGAYEGQALVAELQAALTTLQEVAKKMKERADALADEPVP